MTPDIVVDIGNSRMKWGRVQQGKIVEMVSLSLTNEREWENQRDLWLLDRTIRWAMAGVNPTAQSRFEYWTRSEVCHIHSFRQIPLTVAIDNPEQVGIDRLLNAVAAMAPAKPVLVVSVGTAVTIDLVDGNATFRGGAILPGFRLMAQSLTQGTAKLPEIAFTEHASPLPGKSTSEAIKTGIYWSILSAINALRASYPFELNPNVSKSTVLPLVLTGGDHRLLIDDMEQPVRVVPDLTLEGIRLVAERMS